MGVLAIGVCRGACSPRPYFLIDTVLGWMKPLFHQIFTREHVGECRKKLRVGASVQRNMAKNLLADRETSSDGEGRRKAPEASCRTKAELGGMGGVPILRETARLRVCLPLSLACRSPAPRPKVCGFTAFSDRKYWISPHAADTSTLLSSHSICLP